MTLADCLGKIDLAPYGSHAQDVEIISHVHYRIRATPQGGLRRTFATLPELLLIFPCRRIVGAWVDAQTKEAALLHPAYTLAGLAT